MSAATWQSVGVNQGMDRGTDYPFAGVVEPVRYLLGDMWLSLAAVSVSAVPLRVLWLYGFGSDVVANPLPSYTPTHAQDMVIVDASDNVVFDTTLATEFKATAWGNNLETLSWRSAAGVLRCTRHLQPPPWDAARTYDTYIAPTGATLDARAWSSTPARVTAIRVDDTVLTGRVVFQAGNNVSITQEAAAFTPVVRAGRRVTRLTMRARPGDGLGQIQDCPETPENIYSINGQRPNSAGDLFLTAAECYRVQRDTYGLKLYNDCRPCCECSDYARTYEGFRGVYQDYLALGRAAERARDQMQLNAKRWNDALACRIDGRLRLLAVAEPVCTLFVGGVFCNLSNTCITNPRFVVTITGFPASPIAPPVCRGTFINGTPGEIVETHPTYTVAVADIQPWETRYFRARFTLAKENCDWQVEYPVTVTLQLQSDTFTWFDTGLPVTGALAAIQEQTAEVVVARRAGCEDCEEEELLP